MSTSVEGTSQSKVHVGRWMVTLVEGTSWSMDVDIGQTYMVLQARGPGLKEVHMIPRLIIIFPRPKIVFPGAKFHPFQMSILKTIH